VARELVVKVALPWRETRFLRRSVLMPLTVGVALPEVETSCVKVR